MEQLNPLQQRLAERIDHTLLLPDATPKQIAALCEQAVEYGFPAVCIHPCYVNFASQLLRATPVKVATVLSFPFGADISQVKSYAAHIAIDHGARELDMVINLGFLKSGEHQKVRDEIRHIVDLSHQRNTIVKVIIEIGLLNQQEIQTVCNIVSETNADYIKTSTGYLSRGVEISDIHLLKKYIAPHVKIKASGGIRSAELALQLIEAGADRIGTSRAVDLITQLEHTADSTS